MKKKEKIVNWNKYFNNMSNVLMCKLNKWVSLKTKHASKLMWGKCTKKTQTKKTLTIKPGFLVELLVLRG